MLLELILYSIDQIKELLIVHIFANYRGLRSRMRKSYLLKLIMHNALAAFLMLLPYLWCFHKRSYPARHSQN
jgi:hypothetical protein